MRRSFEECVAFDLQELAKGAHVPLRQRELRGHALETRRLGAPASRLCAIVAP
jgi:hypothetical protein